ncbi:FadR/GntR family transcriptional regulator [Burkholderia gladioli]|uniref:FadR/GntR family transcriptional regulator n=1 Tax=Burkholderia gladioli TaxID=28095 RepID=UPI000BBD0236|nr:FadR/GntR family transcriptional regulator [Burkholderia gladioli]ATF89295.1 GntR family transcriptional regulator [Burkholderia gladioli pv. gladioli]MBJ9712342.1 FadR family transcriptional regulator [Burkholderia gladioli]MBU9153388.1 FadR family transcriptional regulator [Burkholderia gladioli]MCH7269920.1 FadR family transcriptional regulator [Burkholderia gladioli]MDN7916924.1 FadR/GntR family transcriptional regulator [Burkholderia gladioli]
MSIQPIQNRRLYQQIADKLGALIEAGDFPPGSYLPPERELAEQFGVSRTSVREALIALGVSGRVSVRVGDGVKVRQPEAGAVPAAVPVRAAAYGIPDVPDGKLAPLGIVEVDPELGIALDLDTEIPPFALLQARRLIEPEAAALAAKHGSQMQIAAIHAAFLRNQEDNRSGSLTHPGDRLFHIRIAEASDNPPYALIIKQLLAHKYDPMFRRLQSLYMSNDMPHRSELEHREILDAIRARDAGAARRAMAGHLDEVVRIFGRAMD